MFLAPFLTKGMTGAQNSDFHLAMQLDWPLLKEEAKDNKHANWPMKKNVTTRFLFCHLTRLAWTDLNCLPGACDDMKNKNLSCHPSWFGLANLLQVCLAFHHTGLAHLLSWWSPPFQWQALSSKWHLITAEETKMSDPNKHNHSLGFKIPKGSKSGMLPFQWVNWKHFPSIGAFRCKLIIRWLGQSRLMTEMSKTILSHVLVFCTRGRGNSLLSCRSPFLQWGQLEQHLGSLAARMDETITQWSRIPKLWVHMCKSLTFGQKFLKLSHVAWEDFESLSSFRQLVWAPDGPAMTWEASLTCKHQRRGTCLNNRHSGTTVLALTHTRDVVVTSLFLSFLKKDWDWWSALFDLDD